MLAVTLSIVLTAALAAGLYYLRRALQNAVALDEAAAQLQMERDRVAAMEKAKDEARARRAEEFATEKAAVASADDAARLLSRATDSTNLN